MKKTLIAFSVTISLAIALLLGVGLSACEWFETSVLGKPSQVEIAKREAQERGRIDSLRRADKVVELQKQKQEEEQIVAIKHPYHLIVGCYAEQSNVDGMINTLKANGFEPLTFKMAGLTCVSAISYSNLKEAEVALDKLMDKDFCPDDAWVYYKEQ